MEKKNRKLCQWVHVFTMGRHEIWGVWFWQHTLLNDSFKLVMWQQIMHHSCLVKFLVDLFVMVFLLEFLSPFNLMSAIMGRWSDELWFIFDEVILFFEEPFFGGGGHLTQRVFVETCCLSAFIKKIAPNKMNGDRRWWPSGLIRHVSNSIRDSCLGPRFESPLEITISIVIAISPYSNRRTLGDMCHLRYKTRSNRLRWQVPYSSEAVALTK